MLYRKIAMKKNPSITPIGPLDYWKKHGKESCEKLSTAAGTTYSYWKLICNRVKRPGLDLARRLVDASGGELSLELLCPPVSALRGTGAAPVPGSRGVGAPRKNPAATVKSVRKRLKVQEGASA